MAYRAALRISKNQQCTKYGRLNLGSILSSEQLPALSQERRYHQGSSENNGQEDSQGNWNHFHKIAAGLGVASVAAAVSIPASIDEPSYAFFVTPVRATEPDFL